MKKLVILAALTLSSTAFAGEVENAVGQCNEAMRCDLCRVANDTGEYPNGRLVIVKDATGKSVPKRIPKDDYNWIRNAGTGKDADGRYTMCARVEEGLRSAPYSPRWIAARDLFNVNWDGASYCPPVRK